MSRIVFAAIATPGHIFPILTIAKHLIGLRHQVTIFSGAVFQSLAVEIGANFVAFDQQVDVDYRHLGEFFPERDKLSAGNEQMAQGLMQFFAGPISILSKQLMQLINENRAELLVIDNTFYAALPLLQQAVTERIPVVAIGVTPLPWRAKDSVFWGAKIPPERLPVDLTREQLVDEATQALIDQVRVTFSQAIVKSGGKPLNKEHNEVLIEGVDCYLQLSSQSFEFCYPDIPDHVEFIGMLPVKLDKNHLKINWTDEKAPLVIVTQGTLANIDFNQLVVPTLNALAHLPVRVLAVTGGRSASFGRKGIPANARIVEYIDFEYWLPKASVFVTNGGYGSLTSAIRHGVPMVMAGVGDGKLEAISRVVRACCGISLQTDSPSEKQLLEAITEILSSPLWRQQAQIMKEDSESYDALMSITSHVNRLLV
ncbi:glycosyltransferase [Providencia rettgeri]|nr:glycosyltransferase [Providencia rettgeri]